VSADRGIPEDSRILSNTPFPASPPERAGVVGRRRAGESTKKARRGGIRRAAEPPGRSRRDDQRRIGIAPGDAPVWRPTTDRRVDRERPGVETDDGPAS
jgi:hypothetical protein